MGEESPTLDERTVRREPPRDGRKATAAGTIADKYEILSPLGSGGMGVVQLAWDRVLRRKVVLKRMHYELASTPGYRERFMNEARAVAGLKHPNIVVVHDLDFDEQGAFMVLEHVEGEDLASLLQRRGRLPWKEATALIRPLAEGLYHAHRQGVWHRDVKPGNVLLGTDGTVKLVDFGIARTRHQHTFGVSGMGTPAYMAPEQFQEGELVDHRADVFALGKLWHQLIAGGKLSPPGQPPRLEDLTTLAPAGLNAILARMTAADPGARYYSLGEVLLAIEVLLEDRDRTVPRIEVQPRPRSTYRRPILLAGLLALGLAFWVLDRRPPASFEERFAVDPGKPAIEQTVVEAEARVQPSPLGAESTSPASPPITSLQPEPRRKELQALLDAGKVARAAALLEEFARRGTLEDDLAALRRRVLEEVNYRKDHMPVVPAGCFSMGRQDGRYDEQPVHPVCLEGFRLDRTEVEVGAYRRCVQAGACAPPVAYSEFCNDRRPGGETHPVNCVSWRHAVEFCRWRFASLSSEAQWEFAARGRGTRLYPWGEDPPDCTRSHFSSERGPGCGASGTAAACSREPDRAAFCDLAGNLAEWVLDWYNDGYYAHSAERNPLNEEQSTERVVRGGSWYSRPEELAATARSARVPAEASDVIGFRCASPLED
ncbi:MAG: hypothetical protein A2284_07965 [Deltaproteobacteria bacterium RIFOXYA12_FULL_61_11]|nr:MAG: hypothetical protein A2284_07965 [Deltaproteobacteria bacterium RIFOXYA12_FULL_61_11]